MIAQYASQQPRHRLLPLLTIGLAVLGLIVTTSVVWLVPQWQEQALEARRQRQEEISRQMEKIAPQGQEACLQDEACRQELTRLARLAPTAHLELQPMDPKFFRFIGGAVVTLPVLSCALYVIVSPRYGDADKKWAYGAVGTLLGFWLGAT